MKLLTSILCAMLLLLVAPGYGAIKCSHQYELLGNLDNSFWLLERVGHDCSGSHLLKLTVDGDSVHTELTLDWKHSPERALSKEFDKRWEEGARAVARTLEIPTRGWSIGAPDHVTGDPTDLPVRREPHLTGFSGTPIFWTGAGGHINYQLRDALVDPSGQYLLLITHSAWSHQENVYRLPDDPGDGLILLKCQDSVD